MPWRTVKHVCLYCTKNMSNTAKPRCALSQELWNISSCLLHEEQVEDVVIPHLPLAEELSPVLPEHWQLFLSSCGPESTTHNTLWLHSALRTCTAKQYNKIYTMCNEITSQCHTLHTHKSSVRHMVHCEVIRLICCLLKSYMRNFMWREQVGLKACSHLACNPLTVSRVACSLFCQRLVVYRTLRFGGKLKQI